MTEHAGAVLPELKAKLHKEAQQWKETDESVSDLVSRRVRPKIREACATSRKRAVELIDRTCAGGEGGLQLSPEIVERIQGVGLSFHDIYPQFQPVVHKRFHAEPELPDGSGLQDALPLRKRFVDWLLFRTKARLRRRILGDSNPSKEPIPAAVKAKRMDEAGMARL